jgi:sialate O-acetylesterase
MNRSAHTPPSPAAPAPDAKLQWLSIQDADGQWHWADGKIDGSQLIASAEGVEKPVAVRYAYTSQPLGHLLYNTDGMPVGPFSTGGHDDAPPN